MLHCCYSTTMFCCTHTTTTLLIQHDCFKLFHVTKSFTDSDIQSFDTSLAVAPDLPISCFPSSRGIFRLPIKWQMEIVCQMWSQEGNIKKTIKHRDLNRIQTIRLTSSLLHPKLGLQVVILYHRWFLELKACQAVQHYPAQLVCVAGRETCWLETTLHLSGEHQTVNQRMCSVFQSIQAALSCKENID